eukprot:3010131-Pyramimonas_sp.AAC.1
MEIDDGIRQQVVDTTAERSTIVVSVSDVVVSDDAMEAEMTAGIQADQNADTSLFESILDPPENIITEKDDRPKDINNWTK